MAVPDLKRARQNARARKRRAEKRLKSLRDRFPGKQHQQAKDEAQARIESADREITRLTKAIADAEAAAKRRVIPRSAWGARSPRSESRLGTLINGIFIHHTVGGTPQTESAEEAEMRAIQRFHMDTHGWNDIAYSFVVAPSGRIYEGRGRGIAGAHTEGYNSTSYAICFMGRYDTSKPTEASIASARWIRRDYLKLSSRPLRPHSAVNQTDCPGKNLRARLKSI